LLTKSLEIPETKNKIVVFALEAPRDHDLDVEDYITGFTQRMRTD